jgi:CheY-like chemotaxis protein
MSLLDGCLFTVLMVDDSEEDQLLVRIALDKSGVCHRFHTVENGGQAVKYLLGESPFDDRGKHPLPSIMLLDLKMPPLDGFELLEWVQKQPKFAAIPQIVFSSSAFEHDVELAYKLGANAYIVKPATLPELVRLIQATLDFWGQCRLPDSSRVNKGV